MCFFFFWVLARLFHLSLDLAHVKQAEGETEISNCSSAVVFFMVSEDKENELLLNLLWVWKTLYFSLFFFFFWVIFALSLSFPYNCCVRRQDTCSAVRTEWEPLCTAGLPGVAPPPVCCTRGWAGSSWRRAGLGRPAVPGRAQQHPMPTLSRSRACSSRFGFQRENSSQL